MGGPVRVRKPNELFERMSQEELEAYAWDGALPSWFTDTVAATEGYGPGEPDDA